MGNLVRRVIASSAILGALVLAASDARAELTDLRGPVRVGWGWSNLYRSRILSVSFEDEFSIWRISELAEVQLVLGMDAVRGPTFTPPGKDPTHQGFLSVGVGTGLLLRLGEHGPATVLTATMGPLFEGREDFAPHGIGVAGRAEVFPFYLGIKDIKGCKKGAFYTYALSGLHGWALGRQDWIGAAQGTTYAVGFGIDLGRQVILPILDLAFGGIC